MIAVLSCWPSVTDEVRPPCDPQSPRCSPCLCSIWWETLALRIISLISCHHHVLLVFQHWNQLLPLISFFSFFKKFPLPACVISSILASILLGQLSKITCNETLWGLWGSWCNPSLSEGYKKPCELQDLTMGPLPATSFSSFVSFLCICLFSICFNSQSRAQHFHLFVQSLTQQGFHSSLREWDVATCCTTTESKWYLLFRHPGGQVCKFFRPGPAFCT